GTDSVVGNYIHPGAYFLALKLHPGSTAGDIQPVVVHYASDLPMIPITLTSVGASMDMGVWVWVLGSARAIPRNYRHTVLNDARVFPNPFDYETVVKDAILEAPSHHAFITEFAAPLEMAKNLVFPDYQFGNLDDLRKTTDAAVYLRYLRNNNYP